MSMSAREAQKALKELRAHLEAGVIGQEDLIQGLLLGLLAEGQSSRKPGC